jgi:hypothetical protein
MRVIAGAMLAALLAGCSTPPRDISIEGLNLADGTTLIALQNALPADDRAALGTYALLHWPKSKFYCGEPIGGRQALAATVGEAIDQTRAYEVKLAREQANARTTAALSNKAEETMLINRMEQLVFERDMLYGRMGPAADASPDGRDIKQRLAIMRAELAELRGRSVP